MKKVLIIIPCYNESESIVGVLNDLHSLNPDWDLLVINDCSHDNTSELASKTGLATVIDLPCNLGIGGGVQTGLIYAERNGYDIAVKFDGDGQHQSSELNNLLQPILDGNADVTIGSRFCEKHDGFKSTFTRRIGIKIFEMVNSLLIRQRVTDNTSGFRAYNRESIEFLSDHYPAFDYPEPEEVILLGKNSFKFHEVFTEMQERTGGTSSIYGYKSVYFMIKVLLSVLMVSIRAPKRKITANELH